MRFMEYGKTALLLGLLSSVKSWSGGLRVGFRKHLSRQAWDSWYYKKNQTDEIDFAIKGFFPCVQHSGIDGPPGNFRYFGSCLYLPQKRHVEKKTTNCLCRSAKTVGIGIPDFCDGSRR